VAGTLALNIVATVLLTRASMANYPGGTALALLNKRYANSEHGKPTLLLRNAPIGYLIERFVCLCTPVTPTVHVHISNLAAQSGASLFLHTHAPPYHEHLGVLPPAASAAYHPWIYNKTENLTQADFANSSAFTHVIAESRDALPAAAPGRWEIVDAIDGFDGWKVQRDVLGLVRERGLWGFWSVVQMKRAEKLWIFEKC
jgi:alpha-1,6-mannosyltransferase